MGGVEIGENGQFLPRDNSKRHVLVWQYYVYDESGRDSDRMNMTSARIVVPLSERTLNENCLVVWRLVAIFLKPYGDSLKIAASRINR